MTSNIQLWPPSIASNSFSIIQTSNFLGGGVFDFDLVCSISHGIGPDKEIL